MKIICYELGDILCLAETDCIFITHFLSKSLILKTIHTEYRIFMNNGTLGGEINYGMQTTLVRI